MPMVGIEIGIWTEARSWTGASPPAAPTSDPAVTAINAEGWSVAYTSPPAGDFDPVSNPKYVFATRQGFDGAGQAITFPETLRITKRVRQAFPDQASLDPARSALEDYLYSTDTVAGVTNNSAEASPKPIANWARPNERIVVGNTVPREALEIVAFHRNARGGEQVACVEWTLTDGSNAVTVKASASVISGHPGDIFPVIVYRPAADTDISTLVDGNITVNAKVYPFVGDASSVANSALSVVAREFSMRIFRKDTARAGAPVYAYVATSAGAAPQASTNAATAKANPFGTWAAAMTALATATASNAHGCVIRFMAGTHTIGGSATAGTYAPNGELIFERDPDETFPAVTVRFGSTANHNVRTPYLRIRNLQLVKTGTFSFSGFTAITFESFTLDVGGLNAAWIQAGVGRMIGGTLTNSAVASTFGAGANPSGLYRGIQSSTLATMEGWNVLGCHLSTKAGASLTSAVGLRSQSGTIIAFNRFESASSVNGIAQAAMPADTIGYAFVQNVVEYLSTTSVSAMRVSADSATGNSQHVLLHHNTFAGFFINGRANLFYDDGPTARTNRLMSMVGNIHVQINSKSDVFRGLNEADPNAGTRVGNWSYLYGAGCRGEFSQFIDAQSGGIGGSFAQAFPGLAANIGTSASVRNDPLFVDYKGATSGPSAGAGGGNYALQAGSPAKSRVANPVLKFDLGGAGRQAVNDTAGAYA